MTDNNLADYQNKIEDIANNVRDLRDYARTINFHVSNKLDEIETQIERLSEQQQAKIDDIWQFIVEVKQSFIFLSIAFFLFFLAEKVGWPIVIFISALIFIIGLVYRKITKRKKTQAR